MRAVSPYLVGMVALTVAYGLLAGNATGSSSLLGRVHWEGVLFPAGLLLGAALVSASRRWSERAWAAAGVLILLGLLLPSSVIAALFPSAGAWSYGSYGGLFVFVLISAAIFITAVLVNSVVKETNSGRSPTESSSFRQSRKAYGLLVLGALLLAIATHNAYWYLVWDSTTDALGGLWLVYPVGTAIFSGVLLSVLLNRKMKLIGVGYFLLATTLMIGAAASAREVDYRQLTDERARQANQAILAYYSWEGHYPKSLNEVRPWYAPPLPGPLVIFGQGWCYDSDLEGSYYRLGYLDREHWSDPRLIGRVYETAGELPALPPICAGEVAALQARSPDTLIAYWKEEGIR